MALVVLVIGACGSSEPAPPPNDQADPADQAGQADHVDRTEPNPQTAEDSTPKTDTRAPSLARRIAPLLRAPEPEFPPEPELPPKLLPIDEDIPSTGVTECDEFLRNYLHCVEDTMPESSRPALRKSIREMAETWGGMDESVADTLSNSCRQASESTRKAMESMGCKWE